jgi:hypothetical protein
MKFILKAARNFDVAGELVSFFWSTRWWAGAGGFHLIPAGRVNRIGESSAIAPFIYTVF